MNEDMYLIHFTSFFTNYKKDQNRDDIGFNNLLGIIENGFRFNRQHTYTPTELNGRRGIKLDIGMICLTEANKYDIKKNRDKFGKFGICMKKEWVEKFSGQPVLYTLEGSINEIILNNLNQLITNSYNLFQESKDTRINQISLSIAGISNHFQAITELIKYKYENEWRIIDDPQNDVLQKSIIPWQITEEKNGCEITYCKNYLPISHGNDAEFYIIPKEYEELFSSKVVEPDYNINKIMYFEDL
ncbi:MAG TPA: hypothetical protein DIW44_00175 [Anaerolineaceae bacterium]|nr:hypothetical protein [Anaerolineaceae bacterium]